MGRDSRVDHTGANLDPPPPRDWLALLSFFALLLSSFSCRLSSFSRRRSSFRRRHSSKEAAADAPPPPPPPGVGDHRLLQLVELLEQLEELKLLPQGVLHPAVGGPPLVASARDNRCKTWPGFKIFGLIFYASFLA